MKLINPIISISFCLIIICCFISCSDNTPPGKFTYGETALVSQSQVLSSENESVLKLKLLVNEAYCKATACKCIQYLASREYKEVEDILRTKYKIDLQLTYCSEEDSIGTLLKTGKFDGVICKPWFALRIMPETGFNFRRVADVLDPFNGGRVYGIFIVKKESPVTEAEDLNGKAIAIGQDDSYENYHLAMKSLKDRSIKPASFIRKGGCTDCLNLLMDNKADGACISDYALVASCAVDFAQESSFRIILKTDSIPLCSVLTDMSKVSEENACRLQHALIDLSGEIPGTFASKGFILPVPWVPAPYQEDQ